jgi:hypothetical protein
MKTANLVIAIIYTFILAMVLFTTDDTDTVVGVFMISVPVIMNWISWKNWK